MQENLCTVLFYCTCTFVGIWTDIQWPGIPYCYFRWYTRTIFNCEGYSLLRKHFLILKGSLVGKYWLLVKRVDLGRCYSYALIIGATFGWMVEPLKQHSHVGWNCLGTRLYAGGELSCSIISRLYCWVRISFIFLGGVIGFGLLVPIYGLMNGFPNESGFLVSINVKDYSQVWSDQIRYVGVGAMVVGGVYTLWSMRKTIIEGLSKSFKKGDSNDTHQSRTEVDIPLDKVLVVCGILVVLIFLFYWYATGSLVMALAGALFLAVVSFFFAAVAGYIAGVVGSSNSPVSGMTIATLLFTIGWFG